MKYFLSIILSFWFLTSSNAQTATLEPLKEWAEKRQKWLGDPSELTYVATRCGALYGVLGQIFSNDGQNNEQKKLGVDTAARGLQLAVFALSLAKEFRGDSEFEADRYKSLLGIYTKIIASNRTFHNSIFAGFINDDYKFCIEFEKVTRAAANTINK